MHAALASACGQEGPTRAPTAKRERPEDEGDVEERERVLEAVRSGRMTGRQVVAELGISSGTLGGWVRASKLRAQARQRGRVARFVPVRVEAVAAGGCVAVVELGEGLRVRVEAGFDGGEVARLVRALRAGAC